MDACFCDAVSNPTIWLYIVGSGLLFLPIYFWRPVIEFLLYLSHKVLMMIKRRVWEFQNIYKAIKAPETIHNKQKKKEPSMFSLIGYAQRRKMQIELDNLSNQLKAKEVEHEIQMTLKESELQQKLKDREAEFERSMLAKKNELEIVKKNSQDDLERAKKILEEKHSLKLDEAIALTKLEAEQKIAKVQLEADKKVALVENEKVKAVAKLEAECADKVAKIQQEESTKYHDRMAKALDEMHTKGGIGTKMIHEMSMKLLDHARPGVTESRFLTGRIDGQSGGEPKTIVTDGKTVNAVVS
jgi:hypothetical protein